MRARSEFQFEAGKLDVNGKMNAIHISYINHAFSRSEHDNLPTNLGFYTSGQVGVSVRLVRLPSHSRTPLRGVE